MSKHLTRPTRSLQYLIHPYENNMDIFFYNLKLSLSEHYSKQIHIFESTIIKISTKSHEITPSKHFVFNLLGLSFLLLICFLWNESIT
jgi:hypothetical protein